MLSKAIMEILEKTDWGKLDYLIIDLPPGTSDAAITIMQDIKPDGIVIVTTSQKASIIDAKKSVNMPRELDIPVLGILENMSGEIFGKGGGEKAAKEMNVNFLGRLKLSKKISQENEKGRPFVLDADKEFDNIAERCLNALKKT